MTSNYFSVGKYTSYTSYPSWGSHSHSTQTFNSPARQQQIASISRAFVYFCCTSTSDRRFLRCPLAQSCKNLATNQQSQLSKTLQTGIATCATI